MDAALAAIAAGAATWVLCAMLLPAITHVSTFDYWFESDAPAILNQLTDRFTSSNARASRHPLFALALFPVVRTLQLVTGDTHAAIRLTYAGLAALWAAGFLFVVRGLGASRIEAALFTVLAMVASAAMFWLPVPETFTPAALTLLIAMAAAVWHERTHGLSWAACVLVTAATLSMTSTNVVAGVLLSIVVLGVWRGATAVVAALVLVAAGQGVARYIFPRTEPFFLPAASESAYLFNPLAGGPGDRLAGFFLHGAVLPPIEQGYAGYLSVQQPDLRAVPMLVIAAWAIWAVLLIVGAVGLVQRRERTFGAVLGGVLLSQLVLAVAFGQETFVYALQSGPMLVLLAACGTFTRWRRGVRALAIVLVVLAAVVNGSRFVDAAGLLNQKYAGARMLDGALRELVPSDATLVVGLPPAAAEGRTVPEQRRMTAPGRITRLPVFGDGPVRRGWHLHAEHYSPEVLEAMRQAGARYFVSEYMHGLKTHADVRSYLETHGTLVRSTDSWVIYALHAPENNSGGTP